MSHQYLIIRTVVFCMLVFFGMLYLKQHGLENVQQRIFVFSLIMLALLAVSIPTLFFELLLNLHGAK